MIQIWNLFRGSAVLRDEFLLNKIVLPGVILPFQKDETGFSPESAAHDFLRFLILIFC